MRSKLIFTPLFQVTCVLIHVLQCANLQVKHSFQQLPPTVLCFTTRHGRLSCGRWIHCCASNQWLKKIMSTSTVFFFSVITDIIVEFGSSFSQITCNEKIKSIKFQQNRLSNISSCSSFKVLFPLLDKVRQLSDSASTDKVDQGGNILIHHSRNTHQKQWAETQVLELKMTTLIPHALGICHRLYL